MFFAKGVFVYICVLFFCSVLCPCLCSVAVYALFSLCSICACDESEVYALCSMFVFFAPSMLCALFTFVFVSAFVYLLGYVFLFFFVLMCLVCVWFGLIARLLVVSSLARDRTDELLSWRLSSLLAFVI